MKKRKVKDFIALDAQKLVRDCEEYLEGGKSSGAGFKRAGRKSSERKLPMM